MKHLFGVRWNGVILPHYILPHNTILPQRTMFHLPPRLRLEKTHYISYNIARCSIKWCDHVHKRYIIVFNHMQRFYYLICQSKWYQNPSILIYPKGEISFCAILKPQCNASFISIYDAELADDRNQVDAKIDPRLACFLQNSRCSMLPPCSILPRLTMHICATLADIASSWFEYNKAKYPFAQHDAPIIGDKRTRNPGIHIY